MPIFDMIELLIGLYMTANVKGVKIMGYTFDSTNSQSFKGDCYFKHRHRDYSVYTEFTYTNEHIFFKDENLNPISISSIEEVWVKGSDLTFKGVFFQDNQIVYELEITFYKNYIRNKLLEVIGKTVEVSTGRLILTNEETFREFEVEIKKTHSKITVIDVSTKKPYVAFERNDQLFCSNNVIVAFNNKGNPYYLIFNDKQIPFDFSGFNIIENRYYHAFTQLFGSLNKLRFKGDEAGLMVNDEDVYIFLDYYQVYSFNRYQLKLCGQHRDGSTTLQFTALSGEQSYITFTNIPESLKELLPTLEMEPETFIEMDQEPFTISVGNDGWIFYQSETVQHFFPFKLILSIEVLDNSQKDKVTVAFHVSSLLGKIVFGFIDHLLPAALPNVVKISFRITESLLPKLIKITFREKKLPLLQEAAITDLYSSWGRQINDFLVYNLFGQLIILQNGIKEIQERKNISSQQKNKQILNFMYYAVREQRKTLDQVSIQFPQLLMEEESQFCQNQSEESFERFQRQLLSVSNQIQRHLADIENSLNALSYEIIPRKRIDTHMKERSKTNYWGAALLGGLGIATGGIGLAAAGAVWGLKTFLAGKDRTEIQKVSDENEQYKLEFYINRALDSFDHFMETMLPFYISQVSKSYYSLTRQNAKLLILQNDNGHGKQAIFNRLVELYTVKQLPLEQGDVLTSSTVIEMLMTPAKNNEVGLIASLSD